MKINFKPIKPVARKGIGVALLLTLLSCQSPTITLTGNNGSNTSSSIVGSQGSNVDNTATHTADNSGSGPNLADTCLPAIDLSGSPIGDLSTQPTCGGEASPSPSPSPSGPALLTNPIPGV